MIPLIHIPSGSVVGYYLYKEPPTEYMYKSLRFCTELSNLSYKLFMDNLVCHKGVMLFHDYVLMF